MKKVIETIEAELAELQPFYDEYLKLTKVLTLLKDENAVSAAKEAKNTVKIYRTRRTTGKTYKVGPDMPEKTRRKYGLNVGDIVGNTHQIRDIMGINPGSIYPMLDKRYFVEC